MTTMIDLEKILNWSAPKRISTRNGDRNLRSAPSTIEFRAVWKANKPALKEAGIGWEMKNGEFTGNINWWMPLSQEQVEVSNKLDAESRATDAAIEIPAPEGLEYLPYQKAGISFALNRGNVLIGDEMGLGKTIQAIGVINADESIKKVLIICPASLKLNWAREFKKWRTRPLSVEVINGKGWIEASVTIVNYDILAKHSEELQKEFDLLVIDEAHYCKNVKAKRTKLALTIKAKRRIVLTGTPIPNRPFEIYPLISTLNPARWGAIDFGVEYRVKGSAEKIRNAQENADGSLSYLSSNGSTFVAEAGQWESKAAYPFAAKEFWIFAKKYCAAYRGAQGWDFSGHAHLDQFQRELRETVMIRRLKADVLTELPAKRRAIIDLSGDAGARKIVAEENAAFDQFEDEIEAAEARVAILNEGDDRPAYEAAALSLKDLVSAKFAEIAKLRHDTAVKKTPFAADFIKNQLEDGDNKIIIFAHHRDVIALLMQELNEFNPVKLVGGMTANEKQQSVDRFQKDAACRVFVGNLQAAGVGITLTASSHVIFVEEDWVPGVISQAEDRAHRIGQRNNVLVQHLVLEGSLDARMAHRVIEKQRIADAALDNRTELQAGPVITQIEQTVQQVKKVEEAVKQEKVQANLTRQQIDAAHLAMRILAGMCDGARSIDGSGFNKLDTNFGKALAEVPSLSAKQGAIAFRLATKYQGQLPADLLKEAGIEKKKK